MEAAGLAPGPRAFHVLLCAHLKGGDTPGALGVTGRATEAGACLCQQRGVHLCVGGGGLEERRRGGKGGGAQEG